MDLDPDFPFAVIVKVTLDTVVSPDEVVPFEFAVTCPVEGLTESPTKDAVPLVVLVVVLPDIQCIV